MTTNEKRDFLVKNVLTRKEKNIYSQKVPNRTMIENGYGDCSGTMLYWYKKLFGIDIGINTEAQLKSGAGRRINVSVICGVPDESALKKGIYSILEGAMIPVLRVWVMLKCISETVKYLVTAREWAEPLKTWQTIAEKGRIPPQRKN